MGLHDRDHLAFGQFTRRLQHCGDLDRVVAVIIDDRHAVPHSGPGETPPYATEIGQCLA